MGKRKCATLVSTSALLVSKVMGHKHQDEHDNEGQRQSNNQTDLSGNSKKNGAVRGDQWNRTSPGCCQCPKHMDLEQYKRGSSMTIPPNRVKQPMASRDVRHTGSPKPPTTPENRHRSHGGAPRNSVRDNATSLWNGVLTCCCDRTPCVVILDLDNTLIPTTWMMAQWRAPYTNEMPYATTIDIERDRTRRINEALTASGLFEKLDRMFSDLKNCFGVDMISIVTNAGSKTVEWFYLSYCVPQLKTLLTKHGISIQSTEKWVKELGPPPDAAEQDAFREFYTDVKYHEFGEVLQTFVPTFTVDSALAPSSPASTQPASDECECMDTPKSDTEVASLANGESSTTTTSCGLEGDDFSTGEDEVKNATTDTVMTTNDELKSPVKENNLKSSAATPSTGASSTAGSLFFSRQKSQGNERDALGQIPGPYEQLESTRPHNSVVAERRKAKNSSDGADANNCHRNYHHQATELSTHGPPKETNVCLSCKKSKVVVGSPLEARRRQHEARHRRNSELTKQIDVVSVGDQMCEISAACRLTKDYPSHVRYTKLLIICDGLEPRLGHLQTPSSFVMQLEWLRVHLLELLCNNKETLDVSGERAQWKMSPERNNFLYAVSQPHRFYGPYPQLPSTLPDDEDESSLSPVKREGEFESSSKTTSIETSCSTATITSTTRTTTTTTTVNRSLLLSSRCDDDDDDDDEHEGGSRQTTISDETTIVTTRRGKACEGLVSNNNNDNERGGGETTTESEGDEVTHHDVHHQQNGRDDDDDVDYRNNNEQVAMVSKLDSIELDMEEEEEEADADNNNLDKLSTDERLITTTTTTTRASALLTSSPGAVHVADMFQSVLVSSSSSSSPSSQQQEALQQHEQQHEQQQGGGHDDERQHKNDNNESSSSTPTTPTSTSAAQTRTRTPMKTTTTTTTTTTPRATTTTGTTTTGISTRTNNNNKYSGNDNNYSRYHLRSSCGYRAVVDGDDNDNNNNATTPIRTATPTSPASPHTSSPRRRYVIDNPRQLGLHSVAVPSSSSSSSSSPNSHKNDDAAVVGELPRGSSSVDLSRFGNNNNNNNSLTTTTAAATAATAAKTTATTRRAAALSSTGALVNSSSTMMMTTTTTVLDDDDDDDNEELVLEEATATSSTTTTTTTKTRTRRIVTTSTQMDKDMGDSSGGGDDGCTEMEMDGNDNDDDDDNSNSNSKELIAGIAWQDVDHGEGHLIPDNE